jgi:hypothetical protein
MHSFIDDELVPLASAYCEIRDASYAPGDPGSAEINAWFRRLVQLDNGDWRAPALWALRYHHNDHKFLCQFLERLERLRTHWTNRIANLVLLGRIKNSASANFDFEKKKEKYFKGHTGVATFGLTVEVLNEPSWTPQILEQRQSRLLGKLTGAWQLG